MKKSPALIKYDRIRNTHMGQQNADYEFKKGNYKINIYEGGALIGSSTVALK